MNLSGRSRELLIEAIRWYVDAEAAAVAREQEALGLSESLYQLRRRLDDVVGALGETWLADEPSATAADVLAAVVRSFRSDGIASVADVADVADAAGTDEAAAADDERAREIDSLLRILEEGASPVRPTERWARGRTLPLRMPKKGP